MFGFPSHTKTTYKSNFLRSVTIQLKFLKNPDISLKRNELINILSPVFANCNVVEKKSTTSQNFNAKTPLLHYSDGLSLFVFTSKDSLKQFNIAEDFITITYNGQVYIDFENLLVEIIPILKKVKDLLLIKEFNWVSIRKINIIALNVTAPHKPTDALLSVFNNALIGHYKAIPGSELVNSGFSNLALSGDDKRLNLVYGLMPSKSETKELVLDIDLICENQNLLFDNLENKLTEINKEVFNIFHWSLLDETITRLDVK